MCNCLNMRILFPAAGNAFSEAARLHLQMQSKHDAATNFIDAGNAFKKADPQGNDYSSQFWSYGWIFYQYVLFFFDQQKL